MSRFFQDKKRIVELCLIVLLLVAAGVSYLVINGGRTPGAEAVVRVDGDVIARYPLGVDGVYSLNGGTNTLTIENGEAYVSAAECPNGQCMRQGRVHFTGQCITCLPNHLTVTVEGGEDNGVDVIT